MEENKKEVVLTPNKDVLITHRNSFQKQLLENILDLKRHQAIKKQDPNFQRQNPQTQKYIGIDELIENYRKAAVNALSYVETIDELLAAEDQGTLATAWADIRSIPSPIAEEVQKKEETNEETNEGTDQEKA